MKVDSSISANAGDFLEVLDDSDFVVDEHDGGTEGVGLDGLGVERRVLLGAVWGKGGPTCRQEGR